MAYLTTFLSKIFGKFVVTNQIYEIEGVPSPKSMGWVGSQVCDFFPNKTGFFMASLRRCKRPHVSQFILFGFSNGAERLKDLWFSNSSEFD